jgi:hypothetical protein
MGVQKHYKERFAKKSCRKVFANNSTKSPQLIFSRFVALSTKKQKVNKSNPKYNSFSSFFFGFIAFSGVSQRWDIKNTTKNVLQKNRVEKFLQTIRPKVHN